MSLTIKHNAGFFSCCSVKLTKIVEYINKNKKIPYSVDSTKQFKLYKKNEEDDVTYDYFEYYNKMDIEIDPKIRIDYRHSHQFKKYNSLDFDNTVPLVKKYFTPSNKIKNTIQYLEDKYQINTKNCIGVYFRGTDKKIETQIAPYEDYYQKLKEITSKDKGLEILLQTDTAPFLDFIKATDLKDNIIVIQENIPSYKEKGCHFERTNEQNYDDMFFLFSTFLTISQCKYIVCSSGNCSIWIILFRGHANNVYQTLKCEWVGGT